MLWRGGCSYMLAFPAHLLPTAAQNKCPLNAGALQTEVDPESIACVLPTGAQNKCPLKAVALQTEVDPESIACANRCPKQVPTQRSCIADRIQNPESIACVLLTGDKAGHRPSLSSRQARQRSPLQGVRPPSCP